MEKSRHLQHIDYNKEKLEDFYSDFSEIQDSIWEYIKIITALTKTIELKQSFIDNMNLLNHKEIKELDIKLEQELVYYWLDHRGLLIEDYYTALENLK